MIKKYIYLTLILVTCFSCSSQESKFEVLVKNIMQKNKETLEKESITKFGINFIKPKIKEMKFKNVINFLVKEKKNIKYCENKECEIDIRFDVNSITTQFLSIRESINTFFRSPIDFYSCRNFNYVIIGEDVFKVELIRNKKINNYIKETIGHYNKASDCNYDNVVYVDLYFKQGKSFLMVYNNHFCNISIPIELDESFINFKKSTFLIKA